LAVESQEASLAIHSFVVCAYAVTSQLRLRGRSTQSNDRPKNEILDLHAGAQRGDAQVCGRSKFPSGDRAQRHEQQRRGPAGYSARVCQPLSDLQTVDVQDRANVNPPSATAMKYAGDRENTRPREPVNDAV